ncbi:MAG: hypothetical protein Q8L57_01955 [bacterium]|nr:hypothetical protein [bacterium]
MRKALFLMVLVALMVAIAAPVLAGSRQRRGNDQYYDQHRDHNRSPKIHFDWRIFIPPPPEIVIKPFPDPWPHPDPWPPRPEPRYYKYWVQGYWETIWEYNPHTGRYYQEKVWRPGYWTYQRY